METSAVVAVETGCECLGQTEIDTPARGREVSTIHPTVQLQTQVLYTRYLILL